MEIIKLETLCRVLLVGTVVSGTWMLLIIVLQLFASRRGSVRSMLFLPSWLRVVVLTVVSTVVVPKTANAAAPVGVESNKSKDSSGTSEAILAGSVAVNVGFAAVHLRRRLASIRSQKFGTKSGQVESSGGVVVTETPHWDVLVHVLGPPMVTTVHGERVSFEKGKALELLVWMTEHRDASTRSAARTALWDGLVKDATFSNLVSGIRRSLNASLPEQLEDWIPRTFTDELPLHPGVVTDAELLEIATKNFEGDRGRFVSDLVRRLSEVRNLPFSGADYAWADGEGITTSHVIKVVKAAVLLGEYAIENEDCDLLFLATERGLRVLPGHEQLVSLRMRGHACSGNRTAIKYEWESYARAIEADSWAGATPSSELENLARELSRQ